MLIDTHSHLNHEDFAEDLPQAITRAREAGVERILVAGYDMPSSEKAVEIAGAYEGVVASVGIHPHDAKSLKPADLDRLRELAAWEKVVAIGEIGLDFHYNFSPREEQEEAFRLQIRLAHELDMPIIVHSREAGDDILDILKSEPSVRGVMHCFSQDLETAKQVIDLGFYIGVAGPVTYKRSEELREAVEWTPIDRLLVETDCPYLAPQKFRGKRNEPSYVVYVAEKVAEVKSLPFDTIAEKTTQNAYSLFGQW